MQITVRDLMRRKKGGVTTVREDDSVFDAVQLLIKYNVGALLVMREEAIVGIMSERDVARKVVLAGKVAATTTVSEIMTRNVIHVQPEETVEECMALMTDRRIRHLPVVEFDKMVGIVSIGDIVNSMISQKQFVIEQLEGYITGRI